MQGLGSIRRDWTVPLFVPLLGAYPIAYLARQNPGQYLASTALLVALALVVGMIAVYAIFRLLTRERIAAGLAAVFVLVMFFVYPKVASLVPASGNQDLVGLLYAGLVVLIGFRLTRFPFAARREVSQALTFAGALLLAFSLVPLAFGAIRSAAPLDAPAPAAAGAGAAGQDRPDIYFLVLDGYARSDVLKKYYGFDNHEFLDGLRAQGFVVASRSSSNYIWTFLSINSILNLDYVQNQFAGKIDTSGNDRTLIYEGIRDNATARFLRERGYRFVHVQSTYEATSSNPSADQQIRCERQVFDDGFVRALVEASWLSVLSSKATVDLAECHLANFRALPRVAGDPGPKFVFAHFLLPHHPYLFDRSGNVLRRATLSSQFKSQRLLWEDKDAYLGQLEYVSKLMLKAIDGIRSNSARPPIIVLVSDHGPWLEQGLSDPQRAGIRFATLGAYLLPGVPADLGFDNGSAVNQFRRLLTYYFDADLAPLPDRYFASEFRSPYAFQDVPAADLHTQWGPSTPPALSSAAAQEPH